MELIQEKLFQEYKLERKYYSIFLWTGKIITYSVIIAFLYILFVLKLNDGKFILLSYFAVYSNLSGMIIHKYYEFPQVYFNLISNDFELVYQSYEVISNHKDDILKFIAENIFGRNDKSEFLNYTKEQHIEFLKSKDRVNWKIIGKIYLGKYIIICLMLSFIFV